MDTKEFDELNEDYKMFSRLSNRLSEYFVVHPYATNGQIVPKIQFIGQGSGDLAAQEWWNAGNEVLGYYLAKAIKENMPEITKTMALMVKQDLENEAVEIKKECAAKIRLLESQHGV